MNGLPAKDVELKIGIRRLGGDLKIGDEETYTTDSLGQVAGEFKCDSLPGDKKNNLTLIAKVEDNDSYGNLSVDKTVPWGIYIKPVEQFWTKNLVGCKGQSSCLADVDGVFNYCCGMGRYSLFDSANN